MAVEQALQAMPKGACAVQLREKDLSARAIYELACELRPVTRAFQAPLLINDRVDIAMAAEADGVHLTTNSISAQDARRLWPEALIGVSAHSVEDVKKAAADRADFVVLGPIFATPSKAAYGSPLGLEPLALSKGILPVFAIGGVTAQNARDCLSAGASGVACIRAILGAQEIGQAARELWSAINQ